MTLVSDVINLMNELAPPKLAEEWDNPGLQAGSPAWPVKKIMVALDATPAVVNNACQQNADLLITHHPFIFKAMKQLDYSTPLGRMIETAMNHRLSIFSAHTNLDWTAGGLNDQFAEMIGLKNVSVLAAPAQAAEASPESGQGRMGELEPPLDLAGFAGNIKAALKLQTLRVTGPFDMMVSRVAVCTGGGSGLMDAFFASKAHVFVTGDLRYHDARNAELYNRGLIDAGHFATEHIVVDLLCRKLSDGLAEKGHEVSVIGSDKESEPFINF
ncbi:MAG: Nif3-like dinuclear metal center hexameric protein [Desulfobacterales bacterium]|nr:Nif3-like dinuclear metal center hexameric protein [Desulfobacterales bacterium]